MGLAFFQIIDFLLQTLGWIIIVQVILSWLFAFRVLDYSNQFVRGLSEGLDRILRPLYQPIRKILPDFGGIDISPMVLLISIYVIRILLNGVARDLAMSGAI